MIAGIDNDLSRFVNGGEGQRLDDPTYLGFKVFIPFTDPGCSLTNGDAYNYLVGINETYRAERLLELIAELKFVTQQSHYMFRSISGLDALYDDAYGSPYRGNEKLITISTYESMDMRVAKINNLFRFISYDDIHRKWILPENLMNLVIVIIVSEVRKIRTFLDQFSGGIGNSIDSDKSIALINDQLSTFTFRFDGCNLDIMGINPFMSEISNESPVMVENSISFDFYSVSEVNRIGFLDSLVKTSELESFYHSAFYTISGVNKHSDAYSSVADVKGPSVDKTPDDGLSTYNLDEKPFSKLRRTFEDAKNSKVGSLVYDEIKTKSDSLAYLTNIFETQKRNFKRLLHPTNILKDAIGLAIDFVDAKIKAKLLDGNILTSFNGGFDDSLSNLLVSRASLGDLTDSNALTDLIESTSIQYELGRLVVHNAIDEFGGLGIVSDLTIDVITQVATLGIMTNENQQSSGESTSIETSLPSPQDALNLGQSITQLPNDRIDLLQLVSAIDVIDEIGTTATIGEVISPTLLTEIINNLGELAVCIDSGDGLTGEQTSIIEIVKKSLTPDRIKVISKRVADKIEGKIPDNSITSKLIQQNLGSINVIKIINDPVNQTLGYILSDKNDTITSNLGAINSGGKNNDC